MNKHITLLFLCFAFLPLLSFSQDETPVSVKPDVPAWVCEKGWWVVEGNVHTPRKNTVRFYNLHGQLVYTETLNDVKLKLKRKKVLLRLKSVLDQAVAAWEDRAAAPAGGTLLAVAMKH